MNTTPAPQERFGPFQLIVFVLSIVALLALLVEATCEMPPEVSRLLQGIDNSICIVLLIDFLVRFRQAESKREFMKVGWIDLLASIPTIDVLRFGRLIRLLRVIRILRAIRLVHRILAMVFQHRLKGTLASVALAVFLLLMFSSVSILLFEQSPEANITTAGDAVWWSIETLTTVGYGDHYPVTPEGRFVAVVLMLSGLGLFGTISGLTAGMFIGLPDQDYTDDILVEVRALRAEVAELKAETAFAPAPAAAIRRNIAINPDIVS